MSSLSGRTSNKNIPKFPNDIGTAGQFIKLKNDVNDGFEYTDAGNISLPVASNTTLGGVKIDGNNLAINSTGLLSVTGIPSVTDFITASSTDTLTNKSMTKAQISDFPSIPTKTSDITNDNGFIITSSSIDNTLIKTTKQEIIGDMTDNFTTPQLYIRPVSVSGRDTTLTLEGRRNNGASKSTYLYFNNFDDNDGAGGSTAIMGLISGHISNATDNTGDLRFYTSSNGANLNECLRLASDNKATFSSNVTFNNAPKDAQDNPYITTTSTNTLTNKSITKEQISNFPSIPDQTSDLTNDSGFITASSSNTLTNKSITKEQISNFPSIPEQTSDLTNDSGFITASSSNTLTNKSITKEQISNFPSIPEQTSDLTNNSGFITASSSNTLTNKLMTKEQISNFPSIPEQTSDLTNNSGFITASSSNTLTNKLMTKEQISNFPSIPEQTSDLTNNSGFITASSSNTLTNKLMTKEQISNFPSIPEQTSDLTNNSGFITASSSNTLTNKLMTKEQISNFPSIPDQTSDLTNDSGFITASSSNTLTNKLMTKEQISNFPSIPDQTSDLTNDSGFITASSSDTLTNKLMTKEQISNFPSIPDQTSDLTNDSGFITASSSDTLTNKLMTKEQISNFPSIPDQTSDLTNDSGFITASSSDTLTNKLMTKEQISNFPSIPSGNQIVPDITNNGYFLKSVIVPDGGPESLVWSQLTIPSGSNNFLEDYSQTNSINLKSTGSNIEFQVANLGTRFQIEAGGRILGSSNMCIETNIGTNVNSTLVPSLLIKTISNTGNDVAVSLRGSRNGANNKVSSKLRFENYDHDFTDIGLMGSIHGFIRNKNDNVGDLRFYTSNDGTAENECLTMNGNSNFIGIGVTTPTAKLDVGGNIKSSGVITASSYVGLPIASNESVGTVIISNSGSLNISSGLLSVDKTTSVTSGSASLVTSGGVSTAINALAITQTRQLIETFAVTQQTDLIGSASQVTFNKSISNTNGITHNSGTAIPQNSLFNVIESGLYIFNISLDVTGVGSARSFVSADIQVYTGSSFSSRGSLFQSPYAIGSAYVRANDGQTNKGTINSCFTIFLDAGRQFEIIGREIYSSGNSSAQVQVQNSSYMTIERIVNSLT